MFKRLLVSCALAGALLMSATPASAWYRYYGRPAYGPRAYYGRPYYARPYAPYYGNGYYGGYYGNGYYGGGVYAAPYVSPYGGYHY